MTVNDVGNFLAGIWGTIGDAIVVLVAALIAFVTRQINAFLRAQTQYYRSQDWRNWTQWGVMAMHQKLSGEPGTAKREVLEGYLQHMFPILTAAQRDLLIEAAVGELKQNVLSPPAATTSPVPESEAMADA